MEINVKGVRIRPVQYPGFPIELRIGDPTSPRSSYVYLSVSEARQLAHLLLAAAEEGKRSEA